MSRYERIDPALAADPVEHLRVYGRLPDGRMVVIVVHDVVEGTVYYARRVRGVRIRFWRGWGLHKVELAEWAGQMARASAARLPRVEAGSGLEASKP